MDGICQCAAPFVGPACSQELYRPLGQYASAPFALTTVDPLNVGVLNSEARMMQFIVAAEELRATGLSPATLITQYIDHCNQTFSMVPC